MMLKFFIGTYMLLKVDHFEGFVIWSKIDRFIINNTRFIKKYVASYTKYKQDISKKRSEISTKNTLAVKKLRPRTKKMAMLKKI